MENSSYYLDQQLKEYKKAVSEAYKQFQLDDESRIAAAHATIRSAIAEYRESRDPQEKHTRREVISGMLSIAAACHLVSFDDLKKYKIDAGIDQVEVPLKITF